MTNLSIKLSAACFSVLCAFTLSLGGATLSTVPMNAVPTFVPVGEGAVSTIIRDEQGVTITIHTTNLDPGPHTVWALIWNDPESCTGGMGDTCLPPPFGPDVPESVAFGAGGIVGASGKGNFGFRLNLGDTSNVIGGAVRAGLTNAVGAEIHVVMADHGEIIPGEILQQLSSPADSGCGGPCPIVQGAAHTPGAVDAVGMRLNSIMRLLERVALKTGVPVGSLSPTEQ